MVLSKFSDEINSILWCVFLSKYRLKRLSDYHYFKVSTLNVLVDLTPDYEAGYGPSENSGSSQMH